MENGVKVHQKPDIERKLELMPKIVKNRPDEELLSTEESAAYGKGVGQLIWICPTVFTEAYDITFLARFRTHPTVGEYRRLNETIFSIKAEADSHFIFLPRFRAGLPVKTVVVCYASAGETPPPETQAKHKDHQCQLPFFARGRSSWPAWKSRTYFGSVAENHKNDACKL